MVFTTKRSPYAILTVIGSEPITVGEIVRRSGIPRTTVLRMIDICVAEGKIRPFAVSGGRDRMYVRGGVRRL